MTELQEYYDEGLTVHKCFPDSFKPIHGIEGDSSWEGCNVGLEIGVPTGFCVLIFADYLDYQKACQLQPEIQDLTSVRNPDESVSVWFKANPDIYNQYNCYLKDISARLMIRQHIVPAPPSTIGTSACEYLYKASPLISDFEPGLTNVGPPPSKLISLGAIPLRGMMSYSLSEQPAFMEGGLLDYEGKAIIAGVPKARKSLLALNWAFCLQTGLPFLGFQTLARPHVLMLQFEVSERRFRERVKGIAEAYKIPQDTDLKLYFYTMPSLRLDSKHGVIQFRKLVRSLNAEVVILDPMVKIHSGEENEQSEMQRLLDTLDELIADLHISIILVHHLNKPGANSTEPWARIRGSSYIPAWADTLLLLNRPTTGAKPSVEAILRNGEGWQTAIDFGDDLTIKVVGNIIAAVEATIIEEIFKNPSFTRRDLAAKVSIMYNIAIPEIIGIMVGMEGKGVPLPK